MTLAPSCGQVLDILVQQSRIYNRNVGTYSTSLDKLELKPGIA